MNDFDKELEEILKAFARFYSGRDGTPRMKASEAHTAIKQAVDKYVIGKPPVLPVEYRKTAKDGDTAKGLVDTINQHMNIATADMARKQRQSLWGDKR